MASHLKLTIRRGRYQAAGGAVVIPPIHLEGCEIFQPSHARPELLGGRAGIQLPGRLKDGSYLVEEVGRWGKGGRSAVVGADIFGAKRRSSGRGGTVGIIILVRSYRGSVLGDVLRLHAGAIGGRSRRLSLVDAIVINVILVSPSIGRAYLDRLAREVLKRKGSPDRARGGTYGEGMGHGSGAGSHRKRRGRYAGEIAVR